MSTILMSNKDKIIMQLTHYFITKENYSPVVVKGVNNEIWLENDLGPYKIIRINANHIHNKEQYEYDLFKTKNVMKQIKRKTLSLKMNVLNIFLDVDEDVKLVDTKNIANIKLENENDLKNKKTIIKTFPEIEKNIIDTSNDLDFIVNITNDLNEKNANENNKYANLFKKKNIIITNILIAINIFIFVLMYIFGNGSTNAETLLQFGANYGPLVKNGEIYRLITCAFLHIGIIHLLFNMYALYIIGPQIEGFVGKWKYLIIYIVSALTGSLVSIIFNVDTISAGASGAIFGLMGSLLYFGYHYRLYLGSVLKTQIVPLIILNLFLGFMIGGVDNFAHLGGLIGGVITTMALGIKDKTSKSERINGSIVLIILLLFLFYMVFKGM